ncbi:hypothetical protein [Limibacillus halophilus]|uniref:Uncharacterized protein n=1 Tax=Limibacillus halophilus TaxID=1579333 RepID=A0A839SVY9_9PROT|nr:hypothetical protein [Limibacillus halophilus]MBB3066652.1 hypothetical protein [Limibacillus halophilus]
MKTDWAGPTIPQLLTVKQLAQDSRFPWLTESALRHLIFNSQSRFSAAGDVLEGNGLDGAIIRVGRRILINIDEFVSWLNSQSEGGHHD